jgi:hypothetical protein
LEQQKPVSFQNLDGAADRLKKIYGLDFQAACDHEDWERARLGFKKRHVAAHRAGVVDQQYIDESGDEQAVVGRRLQIDPGIVEELTARVAALGEALVLLLRSHEK